MTKRGRSGDTLIDLENLREPALLKYGIREDLWDLRGQKQRIASIYLARLHQMTSGLLPDPFTGRTGAAQAMTILRSGHCCGNIIASINVNGAALQVEAGALLEIGCQSPERKYHESSRSWQVTNISGSPMEALCILYTTILLQLV
ncbi:hypothetical protein CYMTET_12143 [Cymbomonas tetramitiformis]|uniref:Uncharacterized protein n=1 Tax=Cymbomonas tetramitiformis TaxID=36881 RepID=A0AAE0GKV5_9CHLO|nr:hypothetical protein CYMTET_12143 [Cymbomonas tetramitiformis]